MMPEYVDTDTGTLYSDTLILRVCLVTRLGLHRISCMSGCRLGGTVFQKRMCLVKLPEQMQES
jgi:hypothetical protein